MLWITAGRWNRSSSKAARARSITSLAAEEKTNLEVIKTILHILGKDEDLIEFVEDRPGHDVRYSLDCSKLRRGTGMAPLAELC